MVILSGIYFVNLLSFIIHITQSVAVGIISMGLDVNKYKKQLGLFEWLMDHQDCNGWQHAKFYCFVLVTFCQITPTVRVNDSQLSWLSDIKTHIKIHKVFIDTKNVCLLSSKAKI